MEYLVLLAVILAIVNLIISIMMAARMVQMGESIRRMRTQVEEVNDYVFLLPQQDERQSQRPESGLVDMTYPTVRPIRQPREM
jgi:hypothetical protein